MEIADCPYCGAKEVQGLEGCQAIYYEIALKHQYPLTSGLGRAIFDAYCLQHPEVYCVSAKSYAAHLTFLYCWIAQGGRKDMLEALRQGLDGPFKGDKAVVLEVGKRGTLTILHLQQDDVETAAREWITHVWEAYADLHEQAEYYWQSLLAGK